MCILKTIHSFGFGKQCPSETLLIQILNNWQSVKITASGVCNLVIYSELRNHITRTLSYKYILWMYMYIKVKIERLKKNDLK